MERDPTKRKVKPSQTLFDFEDLGESSDDSDFRIEDHCEESDDYSIDSAKENESSGREDNAETVDSDSEDMPEDKVDIDNDVKILSEVQNIDRNKFDPKNVLQIMICSICLGDRSDALNEIIECDKCGVTVHEGCYGVQDTDSVCSSDSPNPTTPWFCDACKAGVIDPDCELCPNKGGIFKETDVGKWTHLVCALYMPGVAFGDVDRLSSITLFEMSYSKWGSKPCSLCKDRRFANTGVPVSCDAGLCKTYFHVTCGQREGLLSEAHSEEADQADPYYAHCKLHSDKNMLKKRKRNWLALSMRSEEIKKHGKPQDELDRIERRLAKYRTKYLNYVMSKPQPWVPTQKMGRLLTTSASACRKLWHKGELSGADTLSLELGQAQIELLSDVHRRWNIQPAFSVEFVAYFLDRNNRIMTLRKQLGDLIEENNKLLKDQVAIQEKKETTLKNNMDELDRNKRLRASIAPYHELFSTMRPTYKLPDLDVIGQPILYPPNHPMANAASTPKPFRKLSEPSESGTERTDEGSVNLNNTCGICYGSNDQHLLAKCDTCSKFYHLGCLDPPLLRMPKKTKLMGWQCSECDNDSDSSVAENVDTEAPRKLRRRDSFDDSSNPFSPEGGDTTMDGQPVPEKRPNKKKRWEKQHRVKYSPDPSEMKPRKHKRHKSSHKQSGGQRQSLKICFKSIPHPTGEGSSYVATPSSDLTHTHTDSSSVQMMDMTPKKEEPIVCVNCNETGTSINLVRCDECLNGFHFHCLDPPVKKSPKVKGYSWHCANCDPTESD